jgi:GAF domain-containing protein
LRTDEKLSDPLLQGLFDAGVRAVISIPLLSSTGHLLGIVSTFFDAPHYPGERELRFMDLLARQTADYLERRHAEKIQKTLIG